MTRQSIRLGKDAFVQAMDARVEPAHDE